MQTCMHYKSNTNSLKGNKIHLKKLKIKNNFIMSKNKSNVDLIGEGPPFQIFGSQLLNPTKNSQTLCLFTQPPPRNCPQTESKPCVQMCVHLGFNGAFTMIKC